MALLNCPECNKEISEKAETCPNCGYPISSDFSIKLQKIDKNKNPLFDNLDKFEVDLSQPLSKEYEVIKFDKLNFVGDGKKKSDFISNFNLQKKTQLKISRNGIGYKSSFLEWNKIHYCQIEKVETFSRKENTHIAKDVKINYLAIYYWDKNKAINLLILRGHDNQRIKAIAKKITEKIKPLKNKGQKQIELFFTEIDKKEKWKKRKQEKLLPTYLLFLLFAFPAIYFIFREGSIENTTREEHPAEEIEIEETTSLNVSAGDTDWTIHGLIKNGSMIDLEKNQEIGNLTNLSNNIVVAVLEWENFGDLSMQEMQKCLWEKLSW